MATTIFYQILWVYFTYEPQQYDTIGFSRKKSLRLERYIFFRLNAGHKPSHQSRSNSMYKVHLQISLALIFIFDLPLKPKVVHIRKNYKLSIFS